MRLVGVARLELWLLIVRGRLNRRSQTHLGAWHARVLSVGRGLTSILALNHRLLLGLAVPCLQHLLDITLLLLLERVLLILNPLSKGILDLLSHRSGWSLALRHRHLHLVAKSISQELIVWHRGVHLVLLLERMSVLDRNADRQ